MLSLQVATAKFTLINIQLCFPFYIFDFSFSQLILTSPSSLQTSWHSTALSNSFLFALHHFFALMPCQKQCSKLHPLSCIANFLPLCLHHHSSSLHSPEPEIRRHHHINTHTGTLRVAPGSGK